ncbi:hypothetical protein Tco_0865728 [Tanacetum coccineum]
MESLNSNSQERERERELQQMQEGKVPSFLSTDDPLEMLNEDMTFLRSAITSRYPQATIQEGNVDMGKALDVSLVVTKSSGTESKMQDISSRSGNDTNALDAYIRLVSDEEPKAKGCDRLVSRAKVIENQVVYTRVMVAHIISISSDTSEESVGSSTSRVVLFGTIPIVIPDDASTMVHVTISPVIHDSAAKIPIIPPKEPKAGVIVVTSPDGVLDLITYSSTDSDSSEDPSSPKHAPTTPTTSPFLCSSDSSKTSRDFSDNALRSSSDTSSSSSSSSSTHALLSTVIASPAPYRIIPAPYGPNGVLRMMTARKRVHPFPARIPANCRRFHSSSSSPPRKRRRTSSCSSSFEGSSSDSSTSLSKRSSHLVTTHSPSSSTEPSHKRCRSPTTLVTLATHTPEALSHVCANLLAPRKRIKGSLAALTHEDTIEESLEVGSETEIDSDIRADIEAYIVAKAATSVKVDTRAEAEIEVEEDDQAKDDAESSAIGIIEIEVDIGAEPIVLDDLPGPIMAGRLKEDGREMFEIALDVVIQQLYDHMMEFPAQRIADIEDEQRAREVGAITVDTKRARMLRRISVLARSVIRLQGALGMTRERVDRA